MDIPSFDPSILNATKILSVVLEARGHISGGILPDAVGLGMNYMGHGCILNDKLWHSSALFPVFHLSLH